jgi:hypothetical protein
MAEATALLASAVATSETFARVSRGKRDLDRRLCGLDGRRGLDDTGGLENASTSHSIGVTGAKHLGHDSGTHH